MAVKDDLETKSVRSEIMYGPTPALDPMAPPYGTYGMDAARASMNGSPVPSIYGHDINAARQSFIPPPSPGLSLNEPRTPAMQSVSGAKDLVRRRSLKFNNASEGVSEASGATERFPSDDELLNEIRHILSTSDLMTITKKKVRQQVGDFFGVDLSSKKEYIHQCIDSILKGEL